MRSGSRAPIANTSYRLELGAEQAQRLADLAVESLAEAEALERAPAPPFEAYLRGYFADV